MKKGKRIFAALLAAAMMVAGASTVMAADNVLDAATFEDSAEYFEEVKSGIFTIVGTADKGIKVSTPEEPHKTADGEALSRYFRFAGGANQIKFNAKKGDKIVVYVQSNGGERQVALYSAANVDAETGKPVAMNPQVAPDKDTTVNVATFEADADGEYYVASVSGGIRIYKITVGEVEAKQDSVPKTGVVSTAAICGVIALAGAGVAVVTGKKKEN